MVMLYNLSLSYHKPGFGKPCVASVETKGIAGDYDPVTKTIRQPDMTAIRECLPHYYRKAFDRTHGCTWFSDGKPAYVTLRDYRGRWLNTVYCQAYLTEAPQAEVFAAIKDMSESGEMALLQAIADSRA